MSDVTNTEVPGEERIEGGSPQEPESGEVTGEDVQALKEEIERLKSEKDQSDKRVRDFQAEKDRVAAELRRREREGMSKEESLQAEKDELEEELRREREYNSVLVFQNARNNMAIKYNIPSDFMEFLTGENAYQLEANAKKLGDLVKQLKTPGEPGSEQPPSVPSGSGSEGPGGEEDEIKEALKRGDNQAAILAKLKRMKRGA